MFHSTQGLLDFAEVGMSILKEAKSLKHVKNVKQFVNQHAGDWAAVQQYRPQLADFTITAVLDKGHFGKVSLVRKTSNEQVYAMKAMCKDVNLTDKARFQEERDLMATATSEWLTKLHFAFHDDSNVYLVMDYHPGGNLWTLLDRPELFGLPEDVCYFPEDVAMFYTMEIAHAIQAVHDMGFVHRDIKPENVVISHSGHIRLVDFGSSARMDAAGKVYGRAVGTPQYLAPELLEGLSVHGKEVDWWSLGVTLYEMLTGGVPFDGDSEIEIYAAISQHQEIVPELEYPPHVSALTRELVAGLLSKRAQRLGYQQVSKHQALGRWAVGHAEQPDTPPYVPKLTHQEDVSHFPQEGLEEDDAHTERRRISIATAAIVAVEHGFDPSKLDYAGFTFVRDQQGDVLCKQPETPMPGPNVQVSSETHEAALEKLKRLETENSKLLEEVTELKRSASAAQLDVRKLKQKVRRSTDSAAISMQQLEVSEEKEHRLQKRIKQLQVDVQRLTNELATAQEERKQAKTAEVTMAIAQRDANRATEELKSVQQRCRMLETENIALREELTQASAVPTVDLHQQQQHQQQIIDSLTQELKKMHARVAEVTETNDRLIASASDLEHKLLLETQQREQLKERLDLTSQNFALASAENTEQKQTIANLEERLRKLNVSMCNMMEGFYSDLQEATLLASKFDGDREEVSERLQAEKEARLALQEELALRDNQLQQQTSELNDVLRQLDKERQDFREKVHLLEEEVNGMARDNFRLETAKAQHDKLLQTLMTTATEKEKQGGHHRLRMRLFRSKPHKFAAPAALPVIPAFPGKSSENVTPDSCKMCASWKSELHLVKHRFQDTISQLQRVQAELDETKESFNRLQQNVPRPSNPRYSSTGQAGQSEETIYSDVPGSSIVPLKTLISHLNSYDEDELVRQMMPDSPTPSSCHEEEANQDNAARSELEESTASVEAQEPHEDESITDLDSSQAVAVTSSQVVTPQMPRNRYEMFTEATAHKGSQTKENVRRPLGTLSENSFRSNKSMLNTTNSRSSNASPIVCKPRQEPSRLRRMTNCTDIHIQSVTNGEQEHPRQHTPTQQSQEELETQCVGEQLQVSQKTVRVLLLSEGATEWVDAVLNLQESILSLRSVTGEQVLTFFDLRRSPSTFVVSAQLSQELSAVELDDTVNTDHVVYISHHPPCWVGQEVLIEADSVDGCHRLARTLKAVAQRFDASVTQVSKWKPQRLCSLSSASDDSEENDQETHMGPDGTSKVSPKLTVLSIISMLDGRQIMACEQGLFWMRSSGAGYEQMVNLDETPAFTCDEAIHQVVNVPELGALVLVLGKARRMAVLPLSALSRENKVGGNMNSGKDLSRARRQNGDSRRARANSEQAPATSQALTMIADSEETMVFAVGTVQPGRTFLFSAHKTCMALFSWNAKDRVFSLLKQAHGPRYTDPTTCMRYLPSLKKFVWGSSRFSTLEPVELDIEDLLDVEDSNLALHLSNEERGLVFPVDVFELEGNRLLLCFSKYGLVVNAAGQAIATDPSLTWHVTTPRFFAQIGNQICIVGVSAIEIQDLVTRKSRVLSQANCTLVGTQAAHVYLTQPRGHRMDLLKLEKPSAAIRASVMSAFSSLLNIDEFALRHAGKQDGEGKASLNAQSLLLDGSYTSKLMTTSMFSDRFRREIAALDDVLGAFDL
eukprot:m.147438 g.147438  ORF g.147438 m.147438 type:complete len:1678 (+) comp16113_c0_seq2:588-5621(+)